jgi:hypothetical protein
MSLNMEDDRPQIAFCSFLILTCFLASSFARCVTLGDTFNLIISFYNDKMGGIIVQSWHCCIGYV